MAKLTERKRLERKLDKAFSIHIKWKDKHECQKCGRTDLQGVSAQCSHVVPRRYRITRWDVDNALCLCPTCHRWWHSEPCESGAWFEEKWPERHARLMEQKRITVKWSLDELEEMLEELE